MEYNEDEVCNKTVSDLLNCSLEFQQFFEASAATLNPEAVAVPLAFAIIFLLGTAGNVLLIRSFARHKKLSTVHNALVVNLAAGDLLMLFASLPVNSVWYTIPYWPFGDPMCRISRFTETLTTAVTIFTLTVLSVERLFLVVGPRRYASRPRSLRSAPAWMILVIWLISVALAMPDIISATIVPMEISGEHKDICLDFDPAFGTRYAKAIVMTKFVVLFCLPLLIIAPCYIALAIHLFFRMFASRSPPAASGQVVSVPNCKTPLTATSVQARRLTEAAVADVATRDDVANRAQDRDQLVAPASTLNDSNNAHQKDGRLVNADTATTTTTTTTTTTNANSSNNKPRGAPTKKQRRLAITVLSLVGVFIMCWLPRHVFLLWYHYDPSPFSRFWHVFKITAFCLLFSNSALNPYVFYVLDLHFRHYVHAVLCCRKPSPVSGRGGVEGRTSTMNVESLAADTVATADDRRSYIAMTDMPPCTGRVDNV